MLAGKVFSTVLIHGKYAESKKDTQCLFSASAEKTKRGKECADYGCSNTFFDSEGKATGIHFSKFPSLS